MEVWYPKADQRPQSGDGGSMKGGPSRGVLHTTETPGWAGSRYYHIEYKPGSGFRQYRPFDRASRGLRHPAWTPQTNRAGDFCVQIAVVAYAGDASKWSDQTYEDIAEFIAWANAEFGIENWSRRDVGRGGEAYGEDGIGRMDDTEWAAFSGWCGHQEVPDNTHWDPGKVDWVRLLGDDMTPEQKETLEWAEKVRPWIDDFIFATTEGVDRADPDGGPSNAFFPSTLIPWWRENRNASGATDQVARTAVAQVAQELKVTQDTLRSV